MRSCETIRSSPLMIKLFNGAHQLDQSFFPFRVFFFFVGKSSGMMSIHVMAVVVVLFSTSERIRVVERTS